MKTDMSGYRSTPLFGGAILCDLPDKFADVSRIRQVPDNQEVYIDQSGFTSIIFDITERVGSRAANSLEDDGRALTAHLEDLVGPDDVDTLKVWNTTETKFSHLGRGDGDNDDGIPAYTLIATQTPRPVDLSGGGGGGKQRQSQSAPDFTALILTLVRLEKQDTDILITINVPHIKGEYDEDEVDLALGKQGELIGDAVEHAARIWSTLSIKDWELFGV